MSRTTNVLLFYGMLAAPLAWTAQLVVGYGIGEAACSAAGRRWGLDPGLWELALTAAAGVLALSGLLTAVWLARRQWQGRPGFMASGGVLVSSIFLVLVLLGGIGSLYVAPCHQA